MWPAVDRTTQRANSSRNIGTAHGFGRIRAIVTRTDATATTDTIAATHTITTPDIFPFSVTFTQPDTLHPSPSVEVPRRLSPMQRLVEKYSLAAVIAGGVAMFALAASALLLVVQANDRADTFQSRYTRTQTAVHGLCVRREGLEIRLRDLERVDVWLQRTMSRLHPHEADVYQRKLVADLRYLRTPVEDGCEQLLP